MVECFVVFMRNAVNNGRAVRCVGKLFKSGEVGGGEGREGRRPGRAEGEGEKGEAAEFLKLDQVLIRFLY